MGNARAGRDCSMSQQQKSFELVSRRAEATDLNSVRNTLAIKVDIRLGCEGDRLKLLCNAHLAQWPTRMKVTMVGERATMIGKGDDCSSGPLHEFFEVKFCRPGTWWATEMVSE